MKQILKIAAIAIAHLVFTRLVITATMANVSSGVFDSLASSTSDLLVALTKVLTFPIISLSLYSRQWFPGNLIFIPFFANSLLWATVVYFSAILCKKAFNRNR